MNNSEERIDATEFDAIEIDGVENFLPASSDDLEPTEPWAVEDFDDLCNETRH